ncbi:hypothetical protein ACFQAT_07065 [Undibacterium arcticum]|uniref:hypothetical protein n=1 Tax=Undibacterium arcticum TaxID=1762892 RepID=UPI0036107056
MVGRQLFDRRNIASLVLLTIFAIGQHQQRIFIGRASGLFLGLDVGHYFFAGATVVTAQVIGLH